MQRSWAALRDLRSALPDALVAGILCGVLACGAVIALGALAVSIDPGVIRAGIVQGLSDGTIPTTDTPAPDGPAGVHPLNECLIHLMAGLRSDDVLLDAITPLAPIQFIAYRPDAADTNGLPNVCPKLVAWAPAGEARFEVGRYHRYLHGHRLLAMLGLRVVDASVVGVGLAAACYGLGLAILVVNIARMRRELAATPLPALPRGPCLAVVGATLLTCYGLPHFAHLLSHAPSTIIFLAFLLTASLLRLDSPPMRRFLLLMAGFGALSCVFEFLIGAFPILVAGYLLVMALDSQGSPAQLQRTVLGLTAMTVAFATALIAKLAVSLAVDPDAARAFLDAMTRRMSWSLEAGGQATRLGVVDLVNALRWKLTNTFPGPPWVGYLLLGLSGAQITLCGGFLVTRKTTRMPALLALSSCAVIGGWYLAFPDHTVQHASFMVRMLVWPVSVGWVLTLGAVLQVRKTPGRLSALGAG